MMLKRSSGGSDLPGLFEGPHNAPYIASDFLGRVGGLIKVR